MTDAPNEASYNLWWLVVAAVVLAAALWWLGIAEDPSEAAAWAFGACCVLPAVLLFGAVAVPR